MASPAYSFLLNRGYRCTADPDIWFDLELTDYQIRPETEEYKRSNGSEGITFGLCQERHRESLCRLWPSIVSSLSGTEPYPIVVAYRGDRVVGFAGPFGVAGSGRGGFMGIVTDPEFRRRKIGTVLFETMCVELRRRGATYTNLYTSLKYGAQEIYFAAGCKAKYVTDHSLMKHLQ